jgi:DNA uptake protein ComE-like DNA-binding protein
MTRTSSVLRLVVALACAAALGPIANPAHAGTTHATATAAKPAAAGAARSAAPASATPAAATQAPAAKAAANDAAKAGALVDLNSASRDELMKLPGVGDATADKIIAGRPWRSKLDLLQKKVVNSAQYARFSKRVIARQSK